MAKTIAMPTSPNFVQSRFSLVRTVGQTISPYTGKQKTQEFDGVYWTAEVTLPPMKRTQAVEWQSFLTELNGTVNNFKFSDPDALTHRGTFSEYGLKIENRANESNATLSFTASTNTIAGGSSTTYFNNIIVGDFIVITGATNEENNGTHKVVTKSNAYTITVDPVAYNSLVDESSVSGCTIKCNVKGATGLTMIANANSHSGTILKGSYLAVSDSSTVDATGYTPVQYILATQDIVETDNGGSAKNQYAIKIEPKLRATASANTNIYVNPAKGLFRLLNNEVDWSADNISNFGITFACIEVV